MPQALANALLAALVLLCLGACHKESERDAQRPAKKPPSATATTPQTLAPDEPQEAFGVPFPPDVRDVHRFPSFVRVMTHMSADELEAFFKRSLTDFEILRPSPTTLRVVGLREYMPEIVGYRFGGGKLRMILEYRMADRRFATAEGAILDDGAPAGSVPNLENRAKSRAKGMPVMLRGSDGQLIAPGARWGEPYLPPPGSYFHDERHRANWGRPFGEWIAP